MSSDMSEFEKFFTTNKKEKPPEDIHKVNEGIDAMEELVSKLQRESDLSERDKGLVEAMRILLKGIRKVANEELGPD